MEANFKDTKSDFFLISIYEFFGTAILVAGIELSSGEAVAVGFSLFVAI